MPLLGVNIDHIATLRQLRRASFPDLFEAMRLCEAAGADSIVAHLREDRRHIQDADVRMLRKRVTTRFNLEMAAAPEIVRIACRLKPDQATLVPERREELTTEGGLDVIGGRARVRKACRLLEKSGIPVSLFIEPDLGQIQAAADLGGRIVEIHTGRYADSHSRSERRRQIRRIGRAVHFGRRMGLAMNAGHGLDYANVADIASLEGIHELNIGYAIVCRAVFVGLKEAVAEMRRLLR